MLIYRYTYAGSRMIVYEYENGRIGHRYLGVVAGNGIGVTLYPQKGGYKEGCTVPYTKKFTNIFRLTRMGDFGTEQPVPAPPPKLPEKAEKAPELPDGASSWTGTQLKLKL